MKKVALAIFLCVSTSHASMAMIINVNKRASIIEDSTDYCTKSTVRKKETPEEYRERHEKNKKEREEYKAYKESDEYRQGQEEKKKKRKEEQDYRQSKEYKQKKEANKQAYLMREARRQELNNNFQYLGREIVTAPTNKPYYSHETWNNMSYKEKLHARNAADSYRSSHDPHHTDYLIGN